MLLTVDNTLANFNGDVDGTGTVLGRYWDGTGTVLTEEDTGLIAEEDPTRTSIMVDYSPNPLSTIQLQFMNDESGHESENRIYLQYLASFGGKKH